MIIYHGTNRAAYKNILKNGFVPPAYFTPYLSTAICYGGPYVFAIEAPQDPLDSWEIIINDPIGPNQILYVQKFDQTLVYLNAEAVEMMHRKAIVEGGTDRILCVACDGYGEYRNPKYLYRYLKEPGGGSFKTRKDPINACVVCNGHGYIKYDTRRPLPPEIMVDAYQDTIHRDVGKSRPVKAQRVKGK
jgi:hypothetical protein